MPGHALSLESLRPRLLSWQDKRSNAVLDRDGGIASRPESNIKSDCAPRLATKYRLIGWSFVNSRFLQVFFANLIQDRQHLREIHRLGNEVVRSESQRFPLLVDRRR